MVANVFLPSFHYSIIFFNILIFTMSNNSQSILMFFLIFLSSCLSGDKISSSITEKRKPFPRFLTIQSNPLNLSETLLNPVRCFIDDQQLIVEEQFNNEYFLRTLDLTSKEIKYQLLKKGPGPNEMNGIFIPINIVPFSTRKMEYLNFNTKTIVQSHINYDKVNDIYSDSIVDHIFLSEKFNEVQQLRKVDHDLYIAAGGIPQGMVHLFSKKGEILHSFPFSPPLDQKISPLFLPHIYSGPLDYNDLNKKIVFSPMIFDEIFIFKVNKNKLELVKNLNSDYPFPSIHPEGYPENTKVYYAAIKAKNKFIYAMYINQDPEKINESNLYQEIHIFDYDGNSILKLRMNHIFHDFDVDEEKKRLYAVVDDDDHPLIEFNLEGLDIF